MRIRPLQSLLLAAALILGQAAALAHTAKHPIFGDSQHNCSLCLLQHNLDHTPLASATLPISFHFDAEVPQSAAATRVVRSSDTHYPIRAPPVSI